MCSSIRVVHTGGEETSDDAADFKGCLATGCCCCLLPHLHAALIHLPCVSIYVEGLPVSWGYLQPEIMEGVRSRGVKQHWIVPGCIQLYPWLNANVSMVKMDKALME